MDQKSKPMLHGLTGEANRIFWSSFTEQEFSELCETSILSEKHKALFYHLHEIQDVPEGDVRMEVGAPDVKRLVRKHKRRGKSK